MQSTLTDAKRVVDGLDDLVKSALSESVLLGYAHPMRAGQALCVVEECKDFVHVIKL